MKKFNIQSFRLLPYTVAFMHRSIRSFNIILGQLRDIWLKRPYRGREIWTFPGWGGKFEPEMLSFFQWNQYSCFIFDMDEFKVKSRILLD